MRKRHTDMLSEALNSLQTSTAVAVCFRLTAPFAIRKVGVQGIPFRIGDGEPYWLRVESDDWVRVDPGDIVLMPHGSAHTIASQPDLEPIPVGQLLAQSGFDEWTGPTSTQPVGAEIRWGGDGKLSTIVAGILSPRDFEITPVLRFLPRLIHIRATNSAMTPRLAATLSAVLDEFYESAQGWTYTVCRLAEIVFCQSLRAYLQSGAGNSRGWLLAMSDPQIGEALALVHRDPARDWTVDGLARAIGMSRSRFASRFEELLGETPMRYLTQIRMSEAAERLVRGEGVVRVAEAAGYASEKAFARAFKQWSGVPPSQYRRTAH